MQKCIKLSRLPKSSGKTRSLLFRRQTPGELPQDLIFIKRENMLDTSHPAVGIPRHIYPSFRSAEFNLSIYPFALLSRYDGQRPHTVAIESWKERVERTIQHPDFDTKKPKLLPVRLHNWHAEQKRLPMSLRIIIPMKSTSKKRVVRTRIGNKLKTAIELVTIKGAEVKKVDGKETLVMNEGKALKMSKEGVIRGWTYIFFPRLPVYLMPYTKLVPLVENALSVVHTQASGLERNWAIKALSQRENIPTPTLRTSRRLSEKKPPRSNDLPPPAGRTVTEDVSSFNPPSTPAPSRKPFALIPLLSDPTIRTTPSPRSSNVKPQSQGRPQRPHAQPTQPFTQPFTRPSIQPSTRPSTRPSSQPSSQPFSMDLLDKIFARRSDQPTTWQSFRAAMEEKDGNADDEEWDYESAGEVDDTLDSKPSSPFPSVASKIAFTPRSTSTRLKSDATQFPPPHSTSTRLKSEVMQFPPPHSTTRTSRNIQNEKPSQPPKPPITSTKEKMFKFAPFVLDVRSKTRNIDKAGRSSSSRMKRRR